MLNKFSFETVPVAEIVRRGLVADTNDHKPVVLVVNNEEIIADTRAAILTGWGYAVMTAYDVETALQLADLVPPELLVCDVILIGMSGVELAIAIRMSVPDCKVLLFSGQAAEAEVLAAAWRSGHDFALIDKPLHPAQLFAHLSKLELKSPRHMAMTMEQ